MGKQNSLIIPVREWPSEAQRRWTDALAPRDILALGRPRVSWRAVTKDSVALAYGAWLGWRKSGDWPDALSPSPQELVAYIAGIRERLAPSSVRQRVEFLGMAVSVVDPDASREAFKTVLPKLRDHVPSRRKRQRLQRTKDLIALGIKVMDEALAQTCDPMQRCLKFRDGLQIALLAARPLRKRNFSQLTIGDNVRLVQNRWRIMVPGPETKTGQPIDVPFPPKLVDALALYLNVIRPQLMKGPTDALWISRRGQRQAPDSIAHNIAKLTAKEFGQPINLHLFRDCASTSIAVEDPKNINIVASVLGHTSLATTLEHYNQARSIDASRQFVSMMTDLRRRHRRTARQTGGEAL